MDDRHLPTEQEKVRVVKIIAWRTCLPAAGLLPLSVFGISRMFPEIGDWVLIHVGFAMSKIDESEAHATLRALEDIGEGYEQELEELKTSQIE